MDFQISPEEYRKAIEPLVEEQNRTLTWEMKFPAAMEIAFPEPGAVSDDDYDEEGFLTFTVPENHGGFLAAIVPVLQMSLMRFTYEVEVSESGGTDPGHQILKKQFSSAACNLKECLGTAKKQSEAIANTFYMPHSAVYRLMPCLCYTYKNRSFLSRHPHREVANLSVYYRVFFMPRQMEAFHENFPDSVGGIAVSNEMLSEWRKEPEFADLTEEGLYQMAKENAVRDSRSEVYQMGDRRFLMLTNEQGYYGSAYAFVGIGEQDAGKIVGESNYLILPLSAHEALIYPAGRSDAETVAGAFHRYMEEKADVSRKPFLPNDVYRVNSHTGEVSIFSWAETKPKQAEGVIEEHDILLIKNPMHPRR